MPNVRTSLHSLLALLALALVPAAAAQTVTVVFPQEPGSLLPHFDLLSLAHEAQDLVFERLFVVDVDGSYIPWLAEEVPTLENGGVSADGRTYTIRLRPGLTWQDGQPLTSADVAFTWKVVTDPNLPIPTRTVWQDIDRIETPDARTAVVHFAQPNLSFLGAASFAGAYILPEHLLAGTDLANSTFHRNPVGSGPFRFVEWQAGSFLRFVRHDGYWGGAAHVESIVIRIVPGSEAQRALLERGEADLVLQLALTELPFVAGLANYEAVRVPTFANWQVWLNNEDPVLADAEVRRALLHALDRDLIASALLGGLTEPSDAALPLGHWAHNPDVRHHAYDPEEAERLLDAAGWRRPSPGAVRVREGRPLGLELVNIAGQADRARIVQALQAYWRAIGVDASIREIDAASFPPTLSGGSYQAAFGFFGEQQEPTWNLWIGTNWQRYGNPDARALLDTYRVTIDATERRRLAQAFQAQVAEDVPVLFIAPRALLAVASTALQGYRPTVTSSLWNANTWRK
jgi:peptide/nickel transport system substrate-binding protein